MDNNTWTITVHYESVSCIHPNFLTATAITTNSAQLGWTESGTASTWDIELGLTGFTPSGAPTQAGVTDNPYTYGGLLENTGYAFYVRAVCDANDFSEWTGPMQFTTLANCLAPGELTASEITSTSADLGWIEYGNAASWDIEIGVAGFSPTGVPTQAGVTQNPFIYGGLSENTSYDFYVRSVCDAGEYSDWVGPLNFSTYCVSISTFPFNEGFDGLEFAPECWLNEKIAGGGVPGTWDRQTTGTHPDIMPYSGEGMARFNSYNYPEGTKGILVSPPLDLPDDFYLVSFRMYRDDDYNYLANEQVNVYHNTVPSVTGASLLGSIKRSRYQEPTEPANGWYQYVFNMPEGSAGTSFVIFEGVSQWGFNMFIDEIIVDAIPACLQPSGLIVSNITTTSADLHWIENGEAESWDIELGTAGFAPTGIPTHAGVSNNPFTYSGLSENTAYDFYVRAVCSDDELSQWTGPYTFRTYCVNAVSIFPFNESFSNSDFPPECWSKIYTNAVYSWHYSPLEGGIARGDFSTNQDEWLITPKLDFSNVTDILLSFDWASNYYWSVIQDKFDVNCKISTDGGAAWTLLWSEEDQGPFQTGIFYTTEIVLDEYIGYQDVLIAWQYIGDDGAPLELDNVVISGLVSVNDISPEIPNVYPNPSDGRFVLEAFSAGQVDVFDMKGHLVASKQVADGKNNIDLSNLPAGIYSLRLFHFEQIHVIRILKK